MPVRAIARVMEVGRKTVRRALEANERRNINDRSAFLWSALWSRRFGNCCRPHAEDAGHGDH
jgi:hypothetical protein